MHKTIITNWNNNIDCKDEVYLLGDIIWKNPHWMKELLGQLNGKIYLVKGGHDRNSVLKHVRDRFEWVKDYYEMDYVSKEDNKNYSFVMMHYPIAFWHRSHYGSIHLHGHSHQNFKPTGKMIDVGIDHPACNYTPFDIEEIIKMMNQIEIKIDHHDRK